MIYDVVIVGCGPAGMCAGIYLLRADKKVLILEKEAIGGKIASSPLVENYPGFEKISGGDLSNKLYEQVEHLGGQIEFETVIQIKDGKLKEVVTDEHVYQARSIILATGSKYRTLGIDKEEDFIGDGISFCVVCDGAFYKNKDVAVIGGGNSAVINALSLSELCRKVYVVQNLTHLTGEKILVEALEKKDNVEIIYQASVQSILGEDEITGIVLDNGTELSIDGMFLAIGQIPETDSIRGLVQLESDNYIQVDGDCKTNVAGIFAAGDCLHKKVKQLTTAMNDGTIAALSAIEYLKELEDVK